MSDKKPKRVSVVYVGGMAVVDVVAAGVPCRFERGKPNRVEGPAALALLAGSQFEPGNKTAAQWWTKHTTKEETT